MKIAVYCQHVLGIGHFFRTLEICRALDRHDVLLITGGPPVPAALPSHVRMVRLPGLGMNREFKGLHATDGSGDVDRIKSRRRRMLLSLFRDEQPAVFLVELYPFGRKAFRFELDPVLEGIRRKTLPPATVICSVRDILVEREDAEKFEDRVVRTLNRYFDRLFIHGDARLVRLEETFTRFSEIRIPVDYTGYVTPIPDPDARERNRHRMGVGRDHRLVVASAGGGKVGGRVLAAVLDARNRMKAGDRTHIQVFTGPYMPESVFGELKRQSGPHVHIRRFSEDFISHLAAADLSVSMAGYNTSMNVLAANVPALVFPFPQNREQGLRARRIEAMGSWKVLASGDLTPWRLAACMDRCLGEGRPVPADLRLDGAARTARWVETGRSCAGSGAREA